MVERDKRVRDDESRIDDAFDQGFEPEIESVVVVVHDVEGNSVPISGNEMLQSEFFNKFPVRAEVPESRAVGNPHVVQSSPDAARNAERKGR